MQIYNCNIYNEYLELDNDDIIKLILEFPELVKNKFIIERLQLIIDQNIYN